uniref:Uncharacterized protein n=1 Tax=Amphimedon queenslandica TaxID=400682 RepID=A0A1X7VT12_AMPQE
MRETPYQTGIHQDQSHQHVSD